MSRPVTLFTGQWADLPFETICKKAKSFGYEGLEIASWGDHLDLQKAATDPAYVDAKKAVLAENGLGCWSIGTHIIGQAVGDAFDERINAFTPAECHGNVEKTREWALQQMKFGAAACKNMGVKVMTGFTGSPIFRWWYSFPPTTDEMVADGFRKTVDYWSPVFDEFDKQGVKFALEVHPGEIAFDYWSWARLLETFENRSTLGFNFDPSHLVWQGMKPELLIRDFPDRVYHVHMKDAQVRLDGRSGILGSHLNFGDLRRGWNFVSLGHGDVDFDAIIRELNSVGYDGPLSVEWEDNGMDREFGATEAAAFVKRMNFSPSTVAFDKDMATE